jgi:hypothetical protein
MKPVDDRKLERYEVDGEVLLKVIFTKSADMKEVRARLVNAGTSGLYVETKEDLPPNALVDLNLKLDGRPLANTLGLVKWVKPGEGAGIEFFYATEEERDALERYLLEWIKTRSKTNARN